MSVAADDRWTPRRVLDPATAALRAAAPALLLYAGLRLLGVLVLAGFAAAAGQDVWWLLVRHDAPHYLGIVERGYDAGIPVRANGTLAPSNLAFFPLYPALVALADGVLPGRAPAAALAVSWAAGLAAAAVLAAIGRTLRDRRTGLMLAAAWAVLPHAVVQSMGYSETLFTALAAATLYALLRGRWLTAGLCCALAGLARPTGGALVVVVGLAALLAVCRRRDGWRPWLAGALAPLGLLGYLGWVGYRLGRPDGYLYVQSAAWQMSFDGGWYTARMLGRVLTQPQPLALYTSAAVVLVAFVLLGLAVAERVPWPLLLYAAIVVLLAVGGAGYFHAKARLLLPAFPLLLPVAYGLAAARRGPATVVLGVLALGSAWYGAYLCLDWPLSP